MSILLFISMPRFHNALFAENDKTVSRRIIMMVQSLKSQSTASQQTFVLNIDLEGQALWQASPSMSEEDLEKAESKGYTLPDDVKIVNVEFPERGIVSLGQAKIYFYAGGYSDKALIHLEDDDYNRSTLQIEPFLSKVIIHDQFINFED